MPIKKPIATAIRTATALVLLAFAPAGCTPAEPPSDQLQDAPSPSGKYVLNVPVETQTANPKYADTKVWKVTIADPAGKVLYKDEASTMVGTLNVYWSWDSKDRVWVYNSDDGRIWRWEQTPRGWQKIESQKSDGMPDSLLPDNVPKR